MADLNLFERQCLAEREAHLRDRFELPRLPPRATPAARAAYLARAVELGFERHLVSADPQDPIDARLIAELEAVRKRQRAARARLEAARAAAHSQIGPTTAAALERSAPTHYERKNAFHHGDLREAAVRVAVERMRTGGPLAVTLRGVARELGVTAPALMYHFRNLEGFRAAVAAATQEQLAVYVGTSKRGRQAGHPSYHRATEDRLAPRVPTSANWAREVIEGWLDYAVENPDVYRQLTGEGWRRPGLGEGWLPGSVRCPHKQLQTVAAERFGRSLPREQAERAGAEFAMTLHGLALCRLDGAAEDELRGLLDRVAAYAA